MTAAKQVGAWQRSLWRLMAGAISAVALCIIVINIAPATASLSTPAPKQALKPRSSLPPFNNGRPANGVAWFGSTLGDGKHKGTGWPTTADMQKMVDLGVKAIRLPFDPRYCLNPDGTINTWAFKRFESIIEYNMRHSVTTVLDAHTYKLFSDPDVANFWSLFAPALEKAIGGPTPLFGIELSNEPGGSSKNLSSWTEPLRNTILAIRSSGYQGYILAGAGDWNNMTFLERALAEVERTGGAVAMDPFNRTIYTGHDYWNKDSNPGKSRNDQGVAVDGTLNFAKRYGPTLDIARNLGVKIIMSELGGGISPSGPLPAYKGVGKDGRQLQEEYFTFAKANEDVLIGTWFWAAGKMGKTYRHKVAPDNEHTQHLQSFWQMTS